MAITLPLTIFGAGLLIYYLFGAATHALPIFAALTAGYAAAALGLSIPIAVLIGAAAFFVTIAAGRFIGLTARGPCARALLTGLFAIPAVIAGGVLGHALVSLAGLSGLVAIVAVSLAALASGAIATTRLVARAA